MNALTRILFAVAIVGGAAGAMPASAAGVSEFRHPPNQLSRQFRDGSCLYKIIYGNFGSVPYATVHLYGGVCNSGQQQPLVVVDAQPDSQRWYSRSPSGGQDACGGYIAFQAAGTPGHIATNMWVYFPATDSWKRFGSTGQTTVPASPFC